MCRFCQALTSAGVKIAPSTYYAARTRPPSARTVRDQALKAEISRVHENNYCVLGARKMHAMLNRPDAAHGLGHAMPAAPPVRLMRDMGLHGIRRAKSPRTTRSAPKEQCPADLVRRHFSAFMPNELWVADITYVRTLSGWVYVAFARRRAAPAGSSAGRRQRACTPTWPRGALKMGIWQRQREGADLTGLIHHSDRGAAVPGHPSAGRPPPNCDAVASVGSKGDSYDNALAEALNSLYKAAHPQPQVPRFPRALAGHRRCRARYRRVGATGRAPSGLTPP